MPRGKQSKPLPAAKRPKPATKKTVRRARVAEGIVAGVKVRDLAARERVSTRTIQTDAASLEVQLRIALELDRRAPRLGTLLDEALDCIQAAMQAAKHATVTTAPGIASVVEVGPDHYARLAAVRELGKYFVLGRSIPKAKEDDDSFALTMEQLRAVKHKLLEGSGGS